MSNSDLMQAFFDSSDAGFYIKDGQGRFLLVNRKGAELLRSSATAVIGKTAAGFVPRNEAQWTEAKDRQVAESGQALTVKSAVDLPGGRRTMLDHKFPISLPGYPGATAGIAFDVTDVE